MRMRTLFAAVVALIFVVIAPEAPTNGQAGSAVKGVVLDDAGRPLGGATVRVQGTSNATVSGSDGMFTLNNLAPGVSVVVSAWKHLYYCAKSDPVVPPAGGIALILRLYQTNDNPDYPWIAPASKDPAEVTCATCKSRVTQIWLDNDAHARSGTNPRFLSMYNGTDTKGNPGIGPGYLRDFPGTSGNCANCHAPGQGLDAPFTTNINELKGVNREFGVHCDFCHKVAGVYLNPANGLPYNNVPGVLSMDVRRPFPDSPRYSIFFGTFDDDNVPEEDSFLPLITKSQWCAPCHQFSFWGTQIYQSFREWLESPYPRMGIECQSCHMPPDGVTTNVAPGMGGVERDPRTIHAHTMPGAGSVQLLQNTVTMTLTLKENGTRNAVIAEVSISNDRAGHHVPTDHPARNIILVVQATDENGHSLPRRSGPTVPHWGGDLAGKPGKGFAKVLRDVKSGQSPVASYWKQALIVSDNRIPAFATDISTYAFAAPVRGGEVSVKARLIFRRAFKDLADQKGWTVPDIIMAETDDNIDVPGRRAPVPPKVTLRKK